MNPRCQFNTIFNFFLSLSITLNYNLAFGQPANIRFKHFTTEDGLSMNSVNNIYQDDEGYMWFATADGLNRFDGYEFTIFKPVANDPNSLSHPRTISVTGDSKGKLWIATTTGIDRYDKKYGKFIQAVSKVGITNLLMDKEDHLWIGTWDDGLFMFDQKDSMMISYRHDSTDESSIGTNAIYTLFQDSKGSLWSAGGGLYDLSMDSKKIISYFDSQRWITSITEDSEGNIWITSEDLICINRKENTVKYYKHDPGDPSSIGNYVNVVCADRNNNLWIGTRNNGLYWFDRENEKFIRYNHQPGNQYSISSDRILDIYEDREANIWIATNGGGVSMIRGQQTPFVFLQHNPDNMESMGHGPVRSFFERRNGNIWIALEGGGLNLFNRKKNSFTRYQHDPDNPYSLGSNYLHSVFEDSKGYVWVVGNGIHKFNPSKSNRFTSLGLILVWSLCEDSRGDIWIGTGVGLGRYNPKKDSLTFYLHDKNDPNSIGNSSANYVFEDSRNNLWIGTDSGLDLYQPSEDNFKHCTNNMTYYISEDNYGKLMVVENEGINYYDVKNDTLFTFLTNENISPIGACQDDSGNFWFSTFNGLVKYDPESGQSQHFGQTDGLPIREFSPRSFLKTGKGEMFFGGTNGFIYFHPDSIKDNPHVPSIVLTDFRLSNKSVPLKGSLGDTMDLESPLAQHINYSEKIILNYTQNIFSFEFAALDYNNPEKNQYKYKLEGFNDDWIYTDAGKRFATYTNLDPGTYRFFVKGSNNDGKWNETGASINIVVLSPPWRTWWANTLYFLGVAGLLFGSIRFLLVREHLRGKIKLEHMELIKIQELDQMKTRFFANISHEFRTPLTLMLGPLQKMYEGSSDGKSKGVHEMILRNGKRLLHLINQLLDFSKLEAGAVPLQASEEDLVGFLKKIFAIFESNAQSRQIRYVFQSDTSELLVYFDRDHLEKIIINLLSNAFKFTSDQGKIFLKLNKSVNDQEVDKGKGIVEIQVEDTGTGIASDKLPYIFVRFYQVDNSSTRTQAGTGIGLALVNELIILHHGSVSVTSRKGTGTTFTIHLPLGKSHLKDKELAIQTDYPPAEATGKYATSTIAHANIQQENDGFQEDIPLLLIIDDNSDMRKYLQEILADGYQVVEAGDGKIGLEQAIKYIPDLVISDIMMPEMDGQELCGKLKKDERTSHIPVVLLTAKAGEIARLEGLEIGADDYITKPFSPLELNVRIKNLIDQRKSLRERFSRDITLLPKDLAITSADERFLGKVLKIMEEQSIDTDFNAESFSKGIGLSRSQLHRKLKALTDQSASDFIRSYRLNHARQLLESNFGNIAEITYEVGFNNPSYFAECFKKQFGVLPSEYALHNTT